MPKMRKGIYRQGKKIMKVNIKKFLGIHIAALAAIAVYLVLPIKCPIKYFLGFECPTCGMTRAMFALAGGDFPAYLDFNPAALPFVLLVFFAIHSRLFPINKRIKNAIIICGTVCVFVIYIFRIIFVENVY